MSVAAVVLAAGRGSRIAGPIPKPLLVFRDRPLVAWAVHAALSSGLAPVLVVVGREGRAVAEAAGEVSIVSARVVEIVESPSWERGIAWSLRAALDALVDRPEVAAVCVGLADQPLVTADAYRRVAAAEPHDRIAVATYHGVPANPVRIPRGLWVEASTLDGDEGARVLVRRHGAISVDCSDAGDPTDVDTIDVLADLEARWSDLPH